MISTDNLRTPFAARQRNYDNDLSRLEASESEDRSSQRSPLPKMHLPSRYHIDVTSNPHQEPTRSRRIYTEHDDCSAADQLVVHVWIVIRFG